MNDNRTRKATEAARLLFKFAEMGFGIKHAHLNLSDAGGGDEKSDRVRKLGAITIISRHQSQGQRSRKGSGV